MRLQTFATPFILTSLLLPAACSKPSAQNTATPSGNRGEGQAADSPMTFALCGGGLPDDGMWKCDPAFADINGDGNLDLAATPRLGGGPRFWFGDGAGNWRESSEGLVIMDRSCGGGISFGDANNDAKLDMIVADHCQGVYVFLGDGAGHWQTATEGLYPKELIPDADEARLQMFLGAEDLDTGDVDGDGNLDILAAASDEGGVSVYLGDGTGRNWSRLPAGKLAAHGWANRVRLVDVNGDQKLDVVTTHGDGPRVWLQDASFQPESAQEALDAALSTQPIVKWTPATDGLPEPVIKGLYTGLAIGDINADGRMDLAVANWVDGPEVYLQHEDGSWKKTADVFPKMHGGAMGLDLADLDRDGHLDIIVTGRLEPDPGFIRGVYVLKGNGGTNWEYLENTGIPATGLAATPGVTCADINNDKVPDIAACSGLIVETAQGQIDAVLPQNILIWCTHLKEANKEPAEREPSRQSASTAPPARILSQGTGAQG